ncbi:MAG TPA: hypothetical protein VHG88_17000 [Burkholderiales bacterium]|nr:hypothetical protein [Burkholderiales bacterium]
MLLGLLSLSFSAAAQYDAGGQNTQGANTDASKLDPATKARVRTEGAVGGIQAAPKTDGAISKDAGNPGRIANEASSDREEARGARGNSVREESSSAGASGDAARARAGSNASVEGGAALGATGVETRPAAKAEQAEKDERRRSGKK